MDEHTIQMIQNMIVDCITAMEIVDLLNSLTFYWASASRGG